MKVCLCCGQAGRMEGRGLCRSCYGRNRRAGTLGQFPLLDQSALRRGGREGLTAEELMAETGLTYRRIDHWCRVGYLRPDGGVGSGSCRVFPPAEVEVARTMARLVAVGMAPAPAESIARGNPVQGLTVTLEPVGAST